MRGEKALGLLHIERATGTAIESIPAFASEVSDGIELFSLGTEPKPAGNARTHSQEVTCEAVDAF